ncbi:acyl-CoA dehydrogenase family protein [Bordetella petrii]|uniref:acyl-CoA dehydrogenase family protein n=1 Tax=Bordetella petrii TaxID=94624 RepID=UPI001E3753E1|nr:acyl-CoA dehydrogenase family protein [Bordetella petrii]MCD0502282.1 acyl-CoA dehydrogenase family protein [Bordetella petrii]
MQFTHEHHELKRTTQRIIAEHLDPYLDEWEASQIFPAHQVMKAFGAAGLLGIGKAAEYGGMELDFSYEMIFAETLGEVRSSGLTSAIGVQSTMCTPALARHGSHTLKREYLAPTIAGDLVGCIGVSEASAGSDVSRIKTWARRDGDDYIINGSKMWITNGVQGDWICLLCNTSQEGGPHRNKSLIVVPLKSPGVSVSRKLDKMVLRASDTAELFFDDVRVPVSNRIGEENKGFIYQMEQFQEERLFVAARGMRSMELAIEATIDYTRQRHAFGGTILSNQVVYHKLAELQAEIEALRALLYRATEQYMNGHDVIQLASMAKYLAGKLSMKIPNECLQYWGGQGVMTENWISRAYRDLRQTAIGGGANEIMLEVIAKTMDIHPGRRA